MPAQDHGLIGGSYPHESSAIDCQRTVNLIPEVVESGSGKSVKSLMSIPGLAAWATLPTAPVRAMFEQDGRAWAVGGSVLYELLTGGTYIARAGAIIDNGTPATIDSSGQPGHQLCVTSGRRLGIFDTVSHLWTPDVRTDSDVGCFVDGYFLSLDTTTSIVWQSDFENGLVWNGLAKLQRNMGGDGLVAMGVNSRLVYLLGSQTSEAWFNAGTSPMAFAPAQSGFFEVGCGAKNSLAWCDNSLMWLGQSEQGPGTVWRSSGYQAQRISTHALAQTLRGYSVTSDAVGWAYVDRDHPFYVLTFPTAGHTWAYDASTGLWAERSFWNTATCLEEQYKPRTHCYAFGKHLVGDGVTGAIYDMNRDTYTDAGGAPLRRLRQGPVIANQMQWLYHRSAWLDIETGAQTTDVSPQVMLEKSDDGGHAWTALTDKALGVTGNYSTRVEWRRLGRSRQRNYRVVITADAPVRIADAYLQVDGGSQ